MYINHAGIADERAVYFSELGLLSANREHGISGSRYSGNKWVYGGSIIKVVLLGPLGREAYELGPNYHVIDINGLADPFISRLPLINTEQWRVGHFRHLIPDGYIDTLSTGENKIVDPMFADYYRKLRFIIRGDLYSFQRMQEVIIFSLGKYDYLLNEY